MIPEALATCNIISKCREANPGKKLSGSRKTAATDCFEAEQGDITGPLLSSTPGFPSPPRAPYVIERGG